MSDTHKTPRRWLIPLLLLSLAANLLIAGMVVGWLISPGGHKRMDIGPARGLVGEPFMRALPEEERRAFIRDVTREAPRIRESRESLRARVDAFLEALRADPYDEAAVATLLAEQREAALRRQDIGEQFLLRRLSEMSAEQRRAYADALETSLKRRSRRPG